MIKTIIFDIGNVLVNFCWKEYLLSKGYSEEMIQKIADATVLDKDWNEVDLGILPYEQILQLFIENNPSIEKEILDTMSDLTYILSKTDYAIPWIQKYKEKGYQILYLSNFSEKVLTECGHAMDFLHYTDGGVFSFRVHLTKPDPQIYQLLLHTYSLNPDECVFLDDSPQNIAAAKKEGIHGIIVSSYEQADKKLEEITSI